MTNKHAILISSAALWIGASLCSAQHLWQKPNPPMPRAEVEAIIGPITQTEPSHDLHVLWVWGYDAAHRPGAHDYVRVRDALLPLIGKVPNVTTDSAYLFPTPEQFDRADAIVFYLHLPQLTDDQYAMLRAYIERGGGVVALHETAIMRPAADGKKLAQCLGMSWDEGRSRWGAIFDEVSIRNDHPVFKGLGDKLVIPDEFYWDLNRRDDINVLGEVKAGPPTDSHGPLDRARLSADASPVFWTLESQKGRVFGTTTGHHTFTYFDPRFRIILFRAIAWAMREKPDPFMPLVFDGITSADGMVGTTDKMRDYDKPRGPAKRD